MNKIYKVEEKMPPTKAGNITGDTVLVFVPKWYNIWQLGRFIGPPLNEWKIDGSPSAAPVTHWTALPHVPKVNKGGVPEALKHLVIPDFDLKQVPTVAAAKKLHDAYQKIFNTSLDLLGTGIQKDRRHRDLAKRYNAWNCALAKHWLAKPENKWRVLDTTVTFQGNGSNHAVDDYLKAKNPVLAREVVVDSESGQGWWYTNHININKVVKFLAPLVQKGAQGVDADINKDDDFPHTFIW